MPKPENWLNSAALVDQQDMPETQAVEGGRWQAWGEDKELNTKTQNNNLTDAVPPPMSGIVHNNRQPAAPVLPQAKNVRSIVARRGLPNLVEPSKGAIPRRSATSPSQWLAFEEEDETPLVKRRSQQAVPNLQAVHTQTVNPQQRSSQTRQRQTKPGQAQPGQLRQTATADDGWGVTPSQNLQNNQPTLILAASNPGRTSAYNKPWWFWPLIVMVIIMGMIFAVALGLQIGADI